MNKNLSSTIQLLRFHFSFFLMPVYFFALSGVEKINWPDAILIFIILHILVYPASNGYNSYMDRDTTPIGGLQNPMQPTQHLFYTTIVLNVLAIILSFLITPLFAIGIFFYIFASLAYSYRKIRLKKYPITGYLTVVIFQGAATYYLVYHGSNWTHTTHIPFLPIVAASLLIGGFYPLTQIYQHKADREDGVATISALLGYRGTFIFTGIVYVFAFITLGALYYLESKMVYFFIVQLCMLPALVYFFIWFLKVRKDLTAANYKNTMHMNLLASICANTAFIILLIINKI